MTKKKGFTLIELLVVVAIIGLLATLSIVALNTARAKARDAKRVGDVKQMQTALELYYSDKGTYPTLLASLSPAYMGVIPKLPFPSDGSACANYPSDASTVYTYAATDSNRSYEILYCLGADTGGIPGNVKASATPAGLK